MHIQQRLSDGGRQRQGRRKLDDCGSRATGKREEARHRRKGRHCCRNATAAATRRNEEPAIAWPGLAVGLRNRPSHRLSTEPAGPKRVTPVLLRLRFFGLLGPVSARTARSEQVLQLCSETAQMQQESQQAPPLHSTSTPPPAPPNASLPASGSAPTA
ncbi:hypothetical protein PIB30_073818 [Stylosanthes scabra]|uniref:Uncharacterized protein n=1 Tax=Stylosanthes scabra TaxID=79078 RepID=A0ABU6YNH3_9FABA|nr:hypothetical protein [Stylosanthes scabra]